MPEDVLPWELLGTESLQDCRIFQVQHSQAQPAGSDRAHDFFTLSAPDWVNVIPITAQGEVVMVRQFRHGARKTTLEIPGGMVDASESPAQAAARELLEETGYEAGSLELLGSVNPNPALFDNSCFTYLARGVRKVVPVRNEGAEQTIVQLVPEGELDARVRNGEIIHALVLAAFHWHTLTCTRVE